MNASDRSAALLAQLSARARAGALPHAFVVWGAGAPELARAMAQLFVCQDDAPPCGVCKACRKAAEGIHPDVVAVAPPPDKREISVGQIRQMRADVYVRPNEAPRKVYLIEPADAMNPNAQNALLKVLEEGPLYAVFLLVCARPLALLPTVRSRCEEVVLPAPDGAPDEQTMQRARTLADLLLQGDRLKLMEFTVPLEKEPKQTVEALLDGTVFCLQPALQTRPARALPLFELLRQVRDAARFNVSPGHLLGWLAAGCDGAK